MIVGAHAILHSRRPEADRAFLRDVLRLPHVDAGQGWLIFGLPPAEVAVHPADANDVHELYLMCADVSTFVAAMTRRGVACGPVSDRGWGVLTQLSLPGGGKIGVYEPRHARPRVARTAKGPRETARRPRRKPARRVARTKTRGR
jgi:hypothetical protein